MLSVEMHTCRTEEAVVFNFILSCTLGDENMKHYEAYQRALQEGNNLAMTYLKLILFGPPRSGKTSTRRRLLKEIENLSELRGNSKSTGVAESTEVIIHKEEDEVTEKKVSSTTVAIDRDDDEWLKLVDAQNRVEHDQILSEWEVNLRYLAKVFYSLILNNEGSESVNDISNQSKVISSKSDNTKESLTNRIKQAPDADSDHSPVAAKLPSGLQSVKKAFDELGSTLLIHSPEKFHRLIENLIMVNMIDVGGQQAFLEMLPLLTTGSALYLLFFRMDQEFEKYYHVKYCKDESTDDLPLRDMYCIKDVLCQGLSAVACFGNHQLTGSKPPHTQQTGTQPTETQPMESQPMGAQPIDTQPTNTQPTDTPPSRTKQSNRNYALLIGTHKDKAVERGVLKTCEASFDRVVFSKLNEFKVDGKGLLLRASNQKTFFQIDNMDGKDNILNMRKRITSILRNPERYCSKDVPPTWLIFRIIVHLMKKPIVTLEECEAIANRLNMRDTMTAALWFLHHHVGCIMYYPEIESMKDIVICNPQAVFDCISKMIIQKFDVVNEESCIDDKDKETFYETGQFTLEQLNLSSQAMDNIHLTNNQLIDLLKHKHIIAEIEAEKYMMPAVLGSAPENELLLSQAEDQTLKVVFKCGFVPYGVFCATVSRLIAHHRWEISSEKVMKNKVEFLIEASYTIKFISQPQHLVINVTADPVATKDRKPLREMCFYVRQVIVSCLEEVISQMKYEMLSTSQKQLFDLAFTCVRDPNYLMKVEGKHGICKCRGKVEMKHDLNEKHTMWFENVSYKGYIFLVDLNHTTF